MVDGHNTIDAEEAQRFVGEIEGCLNELLSLRGSYMADCKLVRERIKVWKEEAAEAGVPKKALNLELKRRELERKIEGLIADADEDDAALADQIREALGDFADSPLGKAALGESGEAPESPKPAKRGRKPKSDAGPEAKSAALDETADETDVRSHFVREAEAERVAENVERLEGGIKVLQ